MSHLMRDVSLGIKNKAMNYCLGIKRVKFHKVVASKA